MMSRNRLIGSQYEQGSSTGYDHDLILRRLLKSARRLAESVIFSRRRQAPRASLYSSLSRIKSSVLARTSVTTIMKTLRDLGNGFCVKNEKVVKLFFVPITENDTINHGYARDIL